MSTFSEDILDLPVQPMQGKVINIPILKEHMHLRPLPN